ncbi:MAG TPA: prepilin-type N-terminal cleavage/methylation domain-containing protein [Archangium sp.]|uniref:prepilin-type N-terminal cleavage/methylation domain-containing protein n=1 Tax=Archangium sp. TaxID=1872627 RepID=UPI002E322B5E|nr:prepilin-type N-terminal cleavage/methylation domain-containing protein [Archangium sp.]HEX5748179.1 prepilin-type N-terminal cleavage/methylation domain-containing protein [Archangium sp.]
MPRKPRGFTLTEVLVTVALLGLFTGLAIVSLGPLNGRYRRRQAAELVAAGAARARLFARDSGRCFHLDVYQDDTPVIAGAPGNRLRLSRRPTADCENPTPLAQLQPVEWIPMPSLTTVRVEPGVEAVWRPNGRLHTEDMTKTPAKLRVTSGGEELSVLLAVNGPVCVRDEPSSEVCP